MHTMKPIMHKKELMENNDIWNAVITVLSESDQTTRDTVLHEATIVFQYYTELESGGHESLLYWAESYIKKVGIDGYVSELVAILEKMGAHGYAVIESNYAQEMWRLYISLESNDSNEKEFLEVIKKADDEYHGLHRKLDDLLERYFIHIHTELIEVVEE